jgi:metal-dependent amidase/aminoacylase/carboxypeptidase family protein
MAASTRFSAVVRGQGGHAGEPHLARDPVIAAAAIVQVMHCFWPSCTPYMEASILTCSTAFV